ncbi:RNA-binding protein [Ruminococcaceae bacterium FB2012]|nr:RNA-binding protein [Ruminococcaceae bacterium FB2012]
MITPKQRAELKALANSLEPAFQVGKGGVNDAQVAQIDDYLRVHELVKIKVLDNSLYTAKEAAAEIAELISAEVVQVIGSKAILYKRNEKEPVIRLKNR